MRKPSASATRIKQLRTIALFSWSSLLTIVVLAFGLSAEPARSLKPSGYVNDFAHLLNAQTAADLESLCREVDQKTNAQIAIVTVHSLDGSDVETYAVNLFHQWGIGPKGKDRGVLILVAVNDRKYRIEVGYGLEPILPDGKVGSFGREAVTFFRQADYSDAVSLLTTRVADTIAADAGVTLNTRPQRAPPSETEYSRTPAGWTFLEVLIIIIVLLVFVGPVFVLFLRALFGFGGRTGRGYYGGWGGGYWGGGGFSGGGFGGGGFGGFGGGSSGGGGASGGW